MGSYSLLSMHSTTAYFCGLFITVLEMGLEPISLAAFDFESNVYTIPPLQRMTESVANISIQH